MRKKLIGKLSLIALSLIVLSAPAAIAEDGGPPAIEKDWNLISVPCDVPLEDFHQALGSDAVEVYSWNGEGYQRVDALDRARGYAINSNAVLNSSYLCDNKEDDTPVSLALKKGWNLIGNPFHKAITFNDAFEGAIGDITVIIEYRGNKFVEITPDTHLKPWRGYWVYSLKDMVITYGTTPGCDSLEIGGDIPDPLSPGGGFSLTAECMIAGAALDVTAEAGWRIGDAEVLAAGQAAGDFNALKAGESTITASYLDSVSNEITVAVTDPARKLYISASRTELNAGDSAELSASLIRLSGAVENVTGAVKWAVSGAGAGSIAGSKFTAEREGETVITATLGGLTSNELKISVLSAAGLTKLYLSADRDSIQIHEHSTLWVIGTYGSEAGEEHRDVTDTVAWALDDEEIGYADEKGIFTPTALGVVSIHATLDGVESNSISILVSEKHLKWLFLSPRPEIESLNPPADFVGHWYGQYAIEKGKSGRIDVYAIYNDESWKQVEAGDLKWEVSDSSLVALTPSNGYVKGLNKGSARVRVYMDGVYSEPVWLHVYGSDSNHFLALENPRHQVIVKKGNTMSFEAIHYVKSNWGLFGDYEAPFTGTRVTNEAGWHTSDQSVAGIAAGLLTGLAPGRADIRASYIGLITAPLAIEVWEPAELNACKPDDPNEQTWTDGTSLASLSADCDSYGACAPATIRFTTAINESSQLRDLDVCLDLYVYNDKYELMKTFRDLGCTPEPLFSARAIEGFRTEYEYSAVWDQKDNDGNCVPAGRYFAVSRFYITYCPVIKVEFEITETCACGGAGGG